MNKKMASVLIAYGTVLTALGIVIQSAGPTSAKISLVSALIAGALSMFLTVGMLTYLVHGERPAEFYRK
jgi:hypothetical protein